MQKVGLWLPFKIATRTRTHLLTHKIPNPKADYRRKRESLFLEMQILNEKMEIISYSWERQHNYLHIEWSIQWTSRHTSQTLLFLIKKELVWICKIPATWKSEVRSIGELLPEKRKGQAIEGIFHFPLLLIIASPQRLRWHRPIWLIMSSEHWAPKSMQE